MPNYQGRFSSGSRPDPIRDTKSPELNYRDPEFNYRVVSRIEISNPHTARSALKNPAALRAAELKLPRGVTDAEIPGVQLPSGVTDRIRSGTGADQALIKRSIYAFTIISRI